MAKKAAAGGASDVAKVMELIKDGLKEGIDAAILAREPLSGLIIRLHDAKLHEDAVPFLEDGVGLLEGGLLPGDGQGVRAYRLTLPLRRGRAGEQGGGGGQVEAAGNRQAEGKLGHQYKDGQLCGCECCDRNTRSRAGR